MASSLTPQQLNAYEAEGIIFPIDVLSGDEASRFINRLDETIALMGGNPKTENLHQLFLNFKWAYDLATHPKVLDAVESVLGPNLLLWATSVFAKQPHDPGFISWHQDGTYWGLDSGKVTTAWIALTESSVGNGCMRVVAGSQAMAIQPHHETYAEDNLLSRGQEIAVEVSEEEATDVVLAPGQMSLHHVNIVHGSNANTSDKKRIGFAARYITPSVKHSGYHQPVVLARGEDTHGNFNLLRDPPNNKDLNAAVESHLRTAREHATELRNTEGAFQKS
jgi:non-heme Fe2+,alpha-ketoglutarate-dependent halogenase